MGQSRVGSFSNLKALSVECHAKQPMYNSPDKHISIKAISEIRQEQSILG